MKKFFCSWTFCRYIVLIFSFAVFFFIANLFDNKNQISNTIIVGAADGPTAIFVSSNIYQSIVYGVMLIVVALVILALYLYIMNKLRKRI